MSDNFQPSDWDVFWATLDWDAFDRVAYPSTDQPDFDENTTGNMDWIGQDKPDTILDSTFSLLPDASAAPMEPHPNAEPMNYGEHHGAASTQPYRSASIPGVYGGSRKPIGQLKHNEPSENGKHDLDMPNHSPTQSSSPYRCADCNTSFPQLKSLKQHAENQEHTSFECSCGVRFSRVDALDRHCAAFRKDTKKFPCTFCKRHRGKKGFVRRDHLVQHLRGYHKFDEEEIEKACPRKRYTHMDACPHAGCAFYGGDEFESLSWRERFTQRLFKKESDYRKHLRDVHDETPFPCRIVGCDRVGSKGYMTKKGLIKHLAKEHPNAATDYYIQTED